MISSHCCWGFMRYRLISSVTSVEASRWSSVPPAELVRSPGSRRSKKAVGEQSYHMTAVSGRCNVRAENNLIRNGQTNLSRMTSDSLIQPSIKMEAKLISISQRNTPCPRSRLAPGLLFPCRIHRRGAHRHAAGF